MKAKLKYLLYHRTKYGNLQGVDQYVIITFYIRSMAHWQLSRFGNKFWENLDEVPGRTRWVEYVEVRRALDFAH